MEHQYPGAISGDENMLAELMLPDQVHNRKEDWTIFFLHKDLSEEEDQAEVEDIGKLEDVKGNEESNAADNADAAGSGATLTPAQKREEKDDIEGGEGPPLIYVLNLVNTKHDPSAKRFVSAS